MSNLRRISAKEYHDTRVRHACDITRCTADIFSWNCTGNHTTSHNVYSIWGPSTDDCGVGAMTMNIRFALILVLGLSVISVAATPAMADQTVVNNSTAQEGAGATIGSIEVTPENPTTDMQVTITPTVRNSESATQSAELTEVSVSGPSTLESVDNLGSLGPGSSIEVPLSTTFEEAGEHRLTVYARGTNADGSVFTVQKPVYITVTERSVDVGVSASAESVNGSTGIEATVTQYGTAAIESGQLEAIADGQVLAREPISNVNASESQTVFFDGSDIPAGDIMIRAEYTVEGEQQTRVTNTTVQYSPQSAAEMALTGVEVSSSGTSYTISGDAANVGGADANGVLIDAAPSETLSTNGGYFIGTVERSEFATFELTVDADSSVEEIPVQVNYSVDGEQYSHTNTIDVSNAGGGMEADPANAQAAPNGPPGGSGSSGLPMTEIGIGVGVLVVIGVVFAVYRWRNP